MELKLKPFDFAQAAARAGLQPNGQPLPGTGAAQGSAFSQALDAALQSVSGMQQESRYMQEQVQLDNPAVSIEQTMIAMQKAQIGFQSVMTVRSRLVQAYSEIMTMQV